MTVATRVATVEPIKKHVGGIVHVDRADLCHPETVAVILDALEERGVLVIPKIGLTDEEQVAFTDALGDRVNFKNSSIGSGTDKAEGIYQVTLDASNPMPEYVLGTFFWHMDGMPVADIPPPKATLLSARKLSKKGGQTQFCSTTAAFASLPEDEQHDIENLRVNHNILAAVRPTLDADDDGSKYRGMGSPRERPLVWTQAHTGRRSLIIGHTADTIVGWPAPEGRALLARLMEWSAQPDFMYSHEWSEGDLVIWNNSGVLHRVIPYDRNSGRMMHRTSLAGTETID